MRRNNISVLLKVQKERKRKNKKIWKKITNERIHFETKCDLTGCALIEYFLVKHITLGDDGGIIIVNSKRTARSDRTIIHRKMCTNQTSTSASASQSTIATAAVAAATPSSICILNAFLSLFVRWFVSRLAIRMENIYTHFRWRVCVYVHRWQTVFDR